ncbi:hypothetical protein M422DRAFT_35476 [Sphaerobolus stellatus SS14]|uniref:Transmembrane protein 188 n=1 Tax=Sphaerobolus stellatus (strain SS14) TaxID=990650 RepID=A0A0C9UFJ8_SPHS4|nr:hypothetical protein M422DRAFT_35476 [Sphaerobolus stellatus SS14]
MARSTPPPLRGSFAPPNDVATYRDLLLFEERLKSNAANLRRRKSKYELFLAQLVFVIILLLLDVLLYTSFLGFPLNFLISRLWPDYPPIVPHSYVASGLLFISVTTLVLFYASGMYAEKIGYANRYVPHANRALRSFNVYLNVRAPPLRSSLNPLSYLFPRSSYEPSPSSPPRGASPRRGSAIPPIPPTYNPRGELIFSSRVDSTFREAYERYRAAFERKREEQRRANQKNWFSFLRWPWIKAENKSQQQPVPHIQVQHTSGSGSGRGTRGRGPSITPSTSRRSSPAPSTGSRSGKKGKASRSGTPLLEAALTTSKSSGDSNFVLSGQDASSTSTTGT